MEQNKLCKKFAKAYKDKGISFYPVECESKLPAVKWKKYQNNIPTDDEISEWFDIKKYKDLAIVTGKVSGLVVIDCDNDMSIRIWQHVCNSIYKQPELLDTIKVRTRRGMHFYYKYPEKTEIKTTNDLFSKHIKIDVISDKASCKAPPSFWSDGKGRYEFIGNGRLKDLPKWTYDDLRVSVPPPVNNGTNGNNFRHPKSDGKKWLNRAISKAKCGNRNQVCLWLSDQLRDDGITLEQAKSIIGVFVSNIPQGNNKFTLHEAISTLKSRFQLPRREPAKRVY